jgi:hypothetical protein
MAPGPAGAGGARWRLANPAGRSALAHGPGLRTGAETAR